MQSSNNQSRNVEHGIVLVLLTDSAPITPDVNDMSQPAGSEGRTREMIALCGGLIRLVPVMSQHCTHTHKLIKKNCFKSTKFKGFISVIYSRRIQSYLQRAGVAASVVVVPAKQNPQPILPVDLGLHSIETNENLQPNTPALCGKD